MIRLEDLEEAIAECQGERNPNAQTCIKLAAYLTIRDSMRGVSNGTGQQTNISTIDSVSIDTLNNRGRDYSYSSGTEFWELARMTKTNVLMEVMDELMTVLEATNPRLYNSVLRKIQEKS